MIGRLRCWRELARHDERGEGILDALGGLLTVAIFVGGITQWVAHGVFGKQPEFWQWAVAGVPGLLLTGLFFWLMSVADTVAVWVVVPALGAAAMVWLIATGHDGWLAAAGGAFVVGGAVLGGFAGRKQSAPAAFNSLAAFVLGWAMLGTGLVRMAI